MLEATTYSESAVATTTTSTTTADFGAVVAFGRRSPYSLVSATARRSGLAAS